MLALNRCPSRPWPAQVHRHNGGQHHPGVEPAQERRWQPHLRLHFGEEGEGRQEVDEVRAWSVHLYNGLRSGFGWPEREKGAGTLDWMKAFAEAGFTLSCF